MKKCLILYDSYHHGNTEKIARAMAEQANAKICTIDKVPTVRTEEYEIIGFGAGIAYGRPYDKMLKAAARFSLQGKAVFVFSTSGMGKAKYNSALIELLKNAGASLVGSFACKGYDTYGPIKMVGGIAKGHPDEEDVAAAKQFIQRIVVS
ncbi:Flavodoxin domain protein [Caprobacter fermentans]|uniref:Flavodoxin domain protein n=1 Tax=Caproicibacter fermentans TaxID=2576756 RepID=A0A6N8I4S4_9FIRM|nr:flavodoxin family protein [Caproicibacter fermentans]MVB12767.1 Flavodoxin domain protein [Caproicibacter fermentans]